MEEFFERLLEAAGDEPGAVEFLVLTLGALLEYVVPPVPGDVIVLLGAFLVGSNGWSWPLVLLAVNVGSAVGLSIDYLFGRWVGSRDAEWRERRRWWRRLGGSIDRVKAAFDRHGVAFIAVNRFLPAVRAAFFVAAGLARLPYWKVLLWGIVSSLGWNALIFAVGVSVGYHRERLFGFFRTYSVLAWAFIALVVLVVSWRAWRASRGRRPSA